MAFLLEVLSTVTLQIPYQEDTVSKNCIIKNTQNGQLQLKKQWTSRKWAKPILLNENQEQFIPIKETKPKMKRARVNYLGGLILIASFSNSSSTAREEEDQSIRNNEKRGWDSRSAKIKSKTWALCLRQGFLVCSLWESLAVSALLRKWNETRLCGCVLSVGWVVVALELAKSFGGT